MLFAILILLLVFHHRNRRWYAYHGYWGYPHYRGVGPYGPASYGYVWNGYAWQPNYCGYGVPYGYDGYRRPFGW